MYGILESENLLTLSFTCEDIGVAMGTNLRICCYRIFLFFIRILTFWNRKYKYYCLYYSFTSEFHNIFVTGILRQITTLITLFCCFENKGKKSCVLCRNFISIYKINRTLHGRLRIRILSSRTEGISHSFASLTSERYFQHWKIKFVFQRGHVISCISYTSKSRLHNVIVLLCLCVFYFTYFL